MEMEYGSVGVGAGCKQKDKEVGILPSRYYTFNVKHHTLSRLCIIFLIFVVFMMGLNLAGRESVERIEMANLASTLTGCPIGEGRITCCSDPKFPVLGGVDVLSYFQIPMSTYAVPGNPDIKSTVMTSHGDYTFYFSSEQNKMVFDETPWLYVPEYGGFDANAIKSIGEIEEATAADFSAQSDVNQFAVIDERLYLFKDDTKKNMYLSLSSENVHAGDIQWIRLFDNRWAASFKSTPNTVFNTVCFSANDLPDYVFVPPFANFATIAKKYA